LKPNLIHPIPVFIRKAEKSLTAVQDHNLHEPVGQVRRPQAPTRLLAQISWGLDNNITQEMLGISGSCDGYVLFRTSDLRAKHFAIEVSDLIVQLGEDSALQHVDLYISSLKWMGHYPDQHGSSLVRAYFQDRGPARQRI
jgi:hypothetical protein